MSRTLSSGSFVHADVDVPLDQDPRRHAVLAAFHANRQRVWAICYRMTGKRADADDLAQEAAARVVEHAAQAIDADPTGWILRLTTRLCIDHLRRKKVERRATELVDPVTSPDWSPGEPAASPEAAALLREDVRFAIVVALQRLSPRQRGVLILHDVCDRSLEEVASLLETNANAAKAVLHRARLALAHTRVREDVDVPVDAQVVQAFADAIEAGAIDRLSELLAADAWGMSDGGGIVVTATKRTFGRHVITRQWQNAKNKLGQPVVTTLIRINGEPAILVRLAAQPSVLIAAVHLETRDGFVASLRVNRDPHRLAMVSEVNLAP